MCNKRLNDLDVMQLSDVCRVLALRFALVHELVGPLVPVCDARRRVSGKHTPSVLLSRSFLKIWLWITALVPWQNYIMYVWRDFGYKSSTFAFAVKTVSHNMQSCMLEFY